MPGKTADLFFISFVMIAGLMLMPLSASAVQNLVEGEVRSIIKSVAIKDSGLLITRNLPESRPVSRTVFSAGPHSLYGIQIFYQSRGAFINKNPSAALAPKHLSPAARELMAWPAGQKTAAADENLKKPVKTQSSRGNAPVLSSAVPLMKPVRPQMLGLHAEDMKTARVAHYIPFADNVPTGRPTSRVIASADDATGMENLAGEDMQEIAGGRPYKFDFTHEGIDVKFWVKACEAPRCWIGADDEYDPILEVHSYKINRSYYDVGLERYGWEIDDQRSQWVREWKNAHITGIYGNSSIYRLDRRPLEFDTYSYARAWYPYRYVRIAVQPYWSGVGWQVDNCKYRENYFIFFKDEFPGERLVPPGEGRPVAVYSVPYWGGPGSGPR